MDGFGRSGRERVNGIWEECSSVNELEMWNYNVDIKKLDVTVYESCKAQ